MGSCGRTLNRGDGTDLCYSYCGDNHKGEKVYDTLVCGLEIEIEALKTMLMN